MAVLLSTLCAPNQSVLADLLDTTLQRAVFRAVFKIKVRKLVVQDQAAQNFHYALKSKK
jgi:hypothetical protein